jgi:FdhD protein
MSGPPSSRPTRALRVSPEGRAETSDRLVVEEPLEIRVSGETLAITMRTPGHDRELVLGFLYAEGLIRSRDDVSSIAHCGRTGDEAQFNTVDVTPSPGVVIDREVHAMKRGTVTSASCGVCGRRSIDDLLERCAVVPSEPVKYDAIVRAVATLPRAQTLFEGTGGCHGAALFDLAGEHVATFEDVGRHNAVDKLVGSRLLAGAVPLARSMLVVSGRTSFDIVQKAAVAGIAVVAGISAASSLAVDLANRAGITLVGFARGSSFVVYAGAERLA